MKPHIRRSPIMGGVWICYIPPRLKREAVAFGHSPKEAYENWKDSDE
jgi:hypothetical protein